MDRNRSGYSDLFPSLQGEFPGFPAGLQLGWLDPSFLPPVDEADSSADDAGSATAELDEIAGELQGELDFNAPRRLSKYTAPELEHLQAIGRFVRPEARRECEHPAELEHVADYGNEELAERVALWLHKHRRRGLSDLDLACQREWSARSLGYGYFYGCDEPALPCKLVELAGRRAGMRRLVLAVLCVSMVQGANGITLSAPDAFSLWGMPPSTWWHVIAWLESRGLLVRMRRYKNNRGEPGSAPVHLCPNWYGPGPELLRLRDRVLAAYGVAPDELVEAAREGMLEGRRARGREARGRENDRRRVRNGQPTWGRNRGRPAPAWALDVIGAAWTVAQERSADRDAKSRGQAMLAGAPIAFGVPAPEAAPPFNDEDLVELAELAELDPAGEDLAELAELAAAVQDRGTLTPIGTTVLGTPPAELDPMARSWRRKRGRLGSSRVVEVPSQAELVAERSGAPGASEVRSCTSGASEPGADRLLTVQRSDGPPMAADSREIGRAKPGSDAPLVQDRTSDAPGAPLRSATSSAPTTQATPTADPWCREERSTWTRHDTPLAAWFERKPGDNGTRPSSGARARALAKDGQAAAPPRVASPASVRTDAAAKLAEDLDAVIRRGPTSTTWLELAEDLGRGSRSDKPPRRR